MPDPKNQKIEKFDFFGLKNSHFSPKIGATLDRLFSERKKFRLKHIQWETKSDFLSVVVFLKMNWSISKQNRR